MRVLIIMNELKLKVIGYLNSNLELNSMNKSIDKQNVHRPPTYIRNVFMYSSLSSRHALRQHIISVTLFTQ